MAVKLRTTENSLTAGGPTRISKGEYRDGVGVTVTSPTPKGITAGHTAHVQFDCTEGWCVPCNAMECEHNAPVPGDCEECCCTCDDQVSANVIVTVDEAIALVRDLREALALVGHPQLHLIEEELLTIELAGLR